MRTVHNVWKPNVCGCSMVFSFDADLPDDQIVHTAVESHTNDRGVTFTTSKCAVHADVPLADLYETVRAECASIGQAVEAVASQLTDEQKSAVRECKVSRAIGEAACGSCNDCTLSVTLDAERKPVVTAPALSDAQRDAVLDAAPSASISK